MSLDQIRNLGGLGKFDKCLGERTRLPLDNQVQLPCQGVDAACHGRDASRLTRHRQQLDRCAALLFIFGATDRHITDSTGIAGYRLDALLVITDHHMSFDLAIFQRKVVQE